ncbi:MAG TPA: hypothetical protein VGK73_29340 [Polyangiaceae bacterium]
MSVRSLPLFAFLFITVACGDEAPPPDSSSGRGNAAGTAGSQGGTPATGGAGTGGQQAGSAGASAGAGMTAGGSAGQGGTGGSAGTSAGVAGSLVAGMSGSAGSAAGTAGTGAGAGGTAGSAGAAGGGTGGVTAGSGGESGSSAGGGAGGTGGGSSALVVDDFEGAMLDSTKWEMAGTGQGTIALSTEQKHGGNQSVKVVGMNGPKYFINRTVFPLPDGVVYFKVWMQFANADWANHIAFVQASPGMESQEIRFGGQANAYHANLAADGDGLSPNPFAQPSCMLCLAPVANEWKCLRGKLDFPNSDAQLYVGDTLAVDAKQMSDWHSGNGVLPQNPTQIGFGWALYGGPMNTVYYDDIAIGYEPIACP